MSLPCSESPTAAFAMWRKLQSRPSSGLLELALPSKPQSALASRLEYSSHDTANVQVKALYTVDNSHCGSQALMEVLIQVRHITKFRVQSAAVTFNSKHLSPFLGSNSGANHYPPI